MAADLTTPATIEAALRESEEKFATAFRVSPDIMSISDFENGCYLEVNEAHEKVFGFSRAESIGRSPLDLGILREQAVRDTMLQQMIAQNGHVRDFRVEAWNRRGEPVIILLSAEVIHLRGQKCVLRNSRDITAAVQAEQALRESEEKFATVFREAPVWIVISDMTNSVCLEVNEAALQASGYRREEVIGRTGAEVGWINAADRERLVQKLQEQGRVADFEMTFHAKDGRELCGLVSCGPIIIGGRPCTLSVTLDITARKQAEAALKESTAQLQSILGVAPIGVARVVNRTIYEVNTAMEQMLGYSREELYGRPTRMLYPTEAEYEAVGRQIVELTQQNKTSFSFETRLQLKDGQIIDVVINTVWLAPANLTAGTVIAVMDISERKQTEQALRESEEKFARAFRATPDAIAITDLETGCFIEANGSYERIFGAPAATFIGKSTLEMNFYRDPADRARIVEQIRAQGSVHNVELLCYNQQREPIVVLYSGEAIELNGRKCLVSVIHDITARKQTEQALRESEEKFAMVFRSSPDAVSVHEVASGRYLDVNPGYQRLFGYTREETLGRTPMEMGVWADPAERNTFVALLQRDGHVRNFQVRFRLRTGEVRLCEISAEVVEINGQPHNISVLRDITQRLQAEQALRDSEEKFAKAFRTSPDAISISEQATGRFLDINEGFVRLSGYTRGELIGHTAEELGIWTAPEDRTRMLAELKQNGRVKNLQVQARSRTGEQGVFLMSVEPVEIGGRACLVIVSRDISEQMQAQKALRESEEKFAMAFRSSPHPLIISELATGRYVDVNLGFERITGYCRDEVIGRTSLDLNIWENLEDREELMRRMQRDGKVRDMELRFRRKYGGILITRCSFESIELAGRPCMLSSIEDITEQRRVEEQHLAMEAQLRQNQKLEALGTLAGGIAHDFNNILTAIIVNQELAVMDVAEPAMVRQRLAEIGRASNRAKELVRQILTFSRQQQHERLKQRLQPIIQEAMGLLRSSLPATIEMDQDLSPEAPPVLADSSQIHQVVMNLSTNAAHAMRHRSGRLTVRLAARVLDAPACLALPGLKPGRYAQLTVADTGHGMEASVLARIFEPFFTTKGPGEGTGLGLPMVHGIMQDHDGGIFVQSNPGVGTTFDLYFPEATDNGLPQAAADTDIVPGHGESILVVDDEEAICRAIGAMLRKIGYRVETFTDPRLALERFRGGPAAFDLLLTDRTMPQLSGPQLIAQARAGWPGLSVLLMSGLESPPDKGSGGEDVFRLVAKPIDIAELSRAVRQALLTKPTS